MKYQVIVRGITLLLGGSHQVSSIWFDSRADAENWLATCVATNKGAGRRIYSTRIRTKGRATSAGRQELHPDAAYIAEGLGETQDFCPSDNA